MQSSPLNIAVEDPCCGKALSKALASGVLNEADTWTHEKCGCVWRAKRVEVTTLDDKEPKFVRTWEPEVKVWVF